LTDQPRADIRARLQQTLGPAYTLEDELRGGMARVFVVRDTQLARRIVVKVLSPEMAEGVSAERFVREIRIAAGLQQANIVPVLTTGSMDGLPYYTMPFVEGQSLRDRLNKDGRFSIREATNVMRDVARALAFAHQNGVMHRDIKPENVLLSHGAAVVTDFGIAKAITDARTELMSESLRGQLTFQGMTIGTPTYMSPEQVTAYPHMDHRADLYSWACVLYELLSGQPPFLGKSQTEVMTAQLAAPPKPIATVRRDCPPALADLVMRCLEKQPSARPKSAQEILETLDHIGAPAHLPLLDRLAQPKWLAALSIAGVGLLALGLLTKDAPRATDRSIAVLPLANVGGDSAQEYLADGMTDELATAIGKMSGVRVASRSLARRYRGQGDLDAREAGRTLGVAYVMQGSVRRVGDKLRVAAQLTNAANGVEVWSNSYERRADEVLLVQDSITRGVAQALGVGERAPSTVTRGTNDAEAYDLYLRGQYLLGRRGRGVRQSSEYFERAIARDPGFARAHAGLALSLELFPYFVATPSSQVFARATAAARRALELDSTLADAYTALGMAYMHAYDWAKAGPEFRNAVEADPKDGASRLQYGRYLLYVGQTDSAAAQMRQAKANDPFSPLYPGWLGNVLSMQGKHTEATAEVNHALEIDSLNQVTLMNGAMVAMRIPDTARARFLARQLMNAPPWIGYTAYVHGKLGESDAARQIIGVLQRQNPRAWNAETAIAYGALGLGDTTLVLTSLERATERGEVWPSFMAPSGPEFDSVRRSARFQAVLRRVGLASP
jgi:serine/threonine protein kinase/Tfp pilus assembly protein PilF